jgi:hypothetical protein
MNDLFSAADFFIPAAQARANPRRLKLMEELNVLLDHSPFLSEGEKQKMAKVIPLFSDDVIKDLTQTLIRQNLRYLQDKTAQP